MAGADCISLIKSSLFGSCSFGIGSYSREWLFKGYTYLFKLDRVFLREKFRTADQWRAEELSDRGFSRILLCFNRLMG